MVPRELLDLPLGQRMLWAALAALVGTIHDGPDLATDVRKFARLEAACRSFGVPPEDFDQCAKLLDYHYHRPWDCYLSKATLDQVISPQWSQGPQAAGWGTRH